MKPGAITYSIFGVYKLFFIIESYLRIDISLRTFLAEYEFWKAFGICLIATTLPETLCLDLTTVPKLPLPTMLYNSYSCWTYIHTQESYVNILVSFGINLDFSSKYIWDQSLFWLFTYIFIFFMKLVSATLYSHFVKSFGLLEVISRLLVLHFLLTALFMLF